MPMDRHRYRYLCTSFFKHTPFMYDAELEPVPVVHMTMEGMRSVFPEKEVIGPAA